jgi:hypothetical protein
LSGHALPAVTVPPGRNAGWSVASFSSVVSGRGPSSALTSVPSGAVTGVISRSKKPFFWASTARCWERSANSSISSRVTRSASATFSAVWPIAMYTSGRPGAGVHGGWPPALRAVVRVSATANSGLWVSGSPSDMPFPKRLTVSTPPATNVSPSPAWMACAAMRIVCSDEEQ